ncbi:hypothetical protein M9458_055615 [Cirrhinus mrigala]|uniref:Uncharacterized protein n=1 Tax=Cirrhinus mrigala TaxID=683832 RepID=A0ABD0MFG4_CIRMR
MSLFSKALRMDLPASRLPHSVTEYSATKGSSSFSRRHCQGMDITRLLLALEQGMRSLEDYIQEREGPRSSLAVFMYYALLCVGSSFTMGAAEEKRDIMVMAAVKFSQPKALGRLSVLIATLVCKPTREMVAALEHNGSNNNAPKVTAVFPESSHVRAALPESSSYSCFEPRHISADIPEPRHISSDLPEPRLITTDRPVSRHVTSDRPESRNATYDCPESRNFTTDHLESRHVLPAAPSSSSIQLEGCTLAGIPKPTYLSHPVFERWPLSVALPIMRIAIGCVRAAFTTAEIPEPSMPTEGSPEVAAEAAEPPEMVDPTSGPEVVAEAAEPPEAVTFTSALVPVVAPTSELLSCPVPATYELFARSITAIDAVSELSACPVTAMEAISELCPSCHDDRGSL